MFWVLLLCIVQSRPMFVYVLRGLCMKICCYISVLTVVHFVLYTSCCLVRSRLLPLAYSGSSVAWPTLFTSHATCTTWHTYSVPGLLRLFTMMLAEDWGTAMETTSLPVKAIDFSWGGWLLGIDLVELNFWSGIRKTWRDLTCTGTWAGPGSSGTGP